MLPQTINPYELDEIALFYGGGLDYIISVLPGESLEDAILDILEMSGYFPTPFTPAFEAEVISIVKNVENSYKNNQCRSMYAGGQISFVNAMTIPSFIDADTVDTIPYRVTDIESYIPQRGLSVDQQSPLYLATLIGKYNYEYFNFSIEDGDTDWQDTFDAALTSATANLPFWVTAGMEGALLGYNISPRGLIPTTAGIVSNQIISSLIGALTTTVGVVYFKWVTRVELLRTWSRIAPENIFRNYPEITRPEIKIKEKEMVSRIGRIEEVTSGTNEEPSDRPTILWGDECWDYHGNPGPYCRCAIADTVINPGYPYCFNGTPYHSGGHIGCECGGISYQYI